MDILRNEAVLNSELLNLDEQDLVELITAEQSGRNRTSILIRIYRRFSKVRRNREAGQMLAGNDFLNIEGSK